MQDELPPSPESGPLLPPIPPPAPFTFQGQGSSAPPDAHEPAPTPAPAPAPAAAPASGPILPTPPRPPVPLLDALLTGAGGPVVRLAFLFYGIVILFAVGYAVFGGTAGRLFGDAMPTGNGLVVGLVVGLAIAAACQILVRTLPPVATAADEIERILCPVSYPAVATLALLSGFAEELLFRGALWPHLALPGTTFLFALVHVVPRRSLLAYPLFALAAGFLLGLLRAATDNVLPCMIAHAAVNGANLGWLEYRRRRGAAYASPPVPQA